jgi:hypothetical protein
MRTRLWARALVTLTTLTSTSFLLPKKKKRYVLVDAEREAVGAGAAEATPEHNSPVFSFLDSDSADGQGGGDWAFAPDARTGPPPPPGVVFHSLGARERELERERARKRERAREREYQRGSLGGERRWSDSYTAHSRFLYYLCLPQNKDSTDGLKNE